MKRQKETRCVFFEGLRILERSRSRVRPKARTTKYLRKKGRKDISPQTYFSQERHASVSQACREFVERAAGMRRHSRMQGREEREAEEEDVDIVEDEDVVDDVADMKYSILAGSEV